MPDSTPVAQLDPESSWDSDMDISATSALKALQPSALEHAGVLYQNPDGKFARSNATTQNDRDGFALRAQIAKGNKLAAIWHVHPGDDDLGQVFSPHDIEVANQLKVPSYILFQKDGSIRKYIPGKTQTYSMNPIDRFSKPGIASKGDPVILNDDKNRKNTVEKAYDTLLAQNTLP